jgi:hypothetical protein
MDAELSRDARALLAAARTADDPSPQDRARMDQAVAARLGAYGIAASSLRPTSAAKGASTAWMSGGPALAGKLVLLAAGIGVAIAALSRAPQASHAPRGTPPAQKSLALNAESVSAPIVKAEAIANVQPPAALTSLPRRARVSTSHGMSGRGQAATPVDRAATPAASDPPLAGGDPLRAEVALIEAASDALRLGRYDRALHLLEVHSARFPSGVLREERKGLRVLALCSAGQVELGREEQQRFLGGSPRSVLADKVRSACAPSGPSGAARPIKLGGQ